MCRGTALVVGLVVCAWSALGRAQVDSASPVPTPEQQEQARRDLAAGQRLLKKGQFEAALVKLQAAYAVEPTASALFGLAIAERETDRTPEAYRSYERLLAGPAEGLAPEDRDRAQRALAELGAVTGTVKPTLSEPGAAVFVDERPLDADLLAHPIHLSGGRHVFAATKPGFEPLNFPVYITVGKLLETSLTLKPAAGAAPAANPPVVPVPVPVPPPVPPSSPTAPPPTVAPAPVAPLSPSPPIAPPPVALPPLPPSPPAPIAPPALAPPPPVAPPPEPLSAAPLPTPVPPPEVAPPLLPPPEPITPVAPLASPSPPGETPGSPPASVAPSAEEPRIGFLLGIVTFPRPVEGEVTVKLGSAFALGLKGSYLPELSVPGIDAKLDLKAVEGIARWFPGDGIFFLGAGFGYQNLKASIGQIVDNNELTITADMSGFFVQPQLGVLWISRSGFALSLSIGLQIPIPKDPVVSATYDGQTVPAQATSTIPQDVVDQAQSSKNNVQSIARLVVKYPFPTLDLLRIGFFF